jgi:hypothetical protein
MFICFACAEALAAKLATNMLLTNMAALNWFRILLFQCLAQWLQLKDKFLSISHLTKLGLECADGSFYLVSREFFELFIVNHDVIALLAFRLGD